MIEKPPSTLCEYLGWDSEHFGFSIARFLQSRLSPETIRETDAWCRFNRIDCLYCTTDADDQQTMWLASRHEFDLVDIRLTLSRSLAEPEWRAGKALPELIRPASEKDMPALRAIARQSHQLTRFYLDPHFSKAKCDALYETWIEKSCQGYSDVVLVAEREDRVVGYITCKSLEPRLGQIGLLAVDRGSTGMGFGSALIGAALDWFRGQNHNLVTVVTQGRNIPAQRSYQRAGFVAHSLQLSYHRWFSTLPKQTLR